MSKSRGRKHLRDRLVDRFNMSRIFAGLQRSLLATRSDERLLLDDQSIYNRYDAQRLKSIYFDRHFLRPRHRSLAVLPSVVRDIQSLRDQLVCRRRQTRRSFLFSSGRLGKGRSDVNYTHRVYTPDSQVSCVRG